MSTLGVLRDWASKGHLKHVKVSEGNGQFTLNLGDKSLNAGEVVEVRHDGESYRYPLGSIFLQISDPNQSLIQYRDSCSKHNVDPVKPQHKRNLISYFGRSKAPRPPKKHHHKPPPPKRKHDRHHAHKRDRHHSSKHKHHRDRDRDRDTHSKPPKKTKEVKVMTTEQVLDNLTGVVDKRGDAASALPSSEQTMDPLTVALQADGFELTPEILQQRSEKSKLIASSIVAQEIPVGNSASILRPAPHRDFQRVLDLFSKPENKSSSTHSPPKPLRAHLVDKKPVIIVPKGMTSPITMINAHEFLFNRRFVPRDIMMRNRRGNRSALALTTFEHKFNARRGGASVEFELMDNPRVKLGMNPKEWDRVVAVISLGAAWQFKDWPRGFSNPVDLFTQVFGFYVGMEGEKLPTDVSKWAVQTSKLSRDKRGLDSVCFATFWDGLEDRMMTKKPELIPTQKI